MIPQACSVISIFFTVIPGISRRPVNVATPCATFPAHVHLHFIFSSHPNAFSCPLHDTCAGGKPHPLLFSLSHRWQGEKREKRGIRKSLQFFSVTLLYRGVEQCQRRKPQRSTRLTRLCRLCRSFHFQMKQFTELYVIVIIELRDPSLNDLGNVPRAQTRRQK